MEEWEDLLQEELGDKVNEYLEKGLTTRQAIGVLETLKAEILPNIMVFEEEWIMPRKKQIKKATIKGKKKRYC